MRPEERREEKRGREERREERVLLPPSHGIFKSGLSLQRDI